MLPSSTPVTLRQAGAADWPAVRALLQAHGLPLDGAQAHLSTFLLAVRGGEVVGCAGAEVHGTVALLRSVAVAPGLQRQGIGRRLVERLIQEARGRDIATLYLLTTTAPDYFARLGFQRLAAAEAPAALKASAEFQGACPASAVLMALSLREAPALDRALPVAVLGAGPVGLAAVAQLIERDLPVVALEAGTSVGANLLDYGHVQLFSPWRFNIDPAMARLLAASGWTPPPADALPRAAEVVERVLRPFAALPQVAASLRLGARVLTVGREGLDKVKSAGRDRAAFVVRYLQQGQERELRARAVIDATGTWNQPNPLGANGLPAAGEAQAREHIFYGIPDVTGPQRARYAGKHTLVVGAGHSAANALLALAELARQAPGTRLAWAVRSTALQRVFGGGAADALPARGALGSALRRLQGDGALAFFGGLRITRIAQVDGRLNVHGLDGAQQPVVIEGIDEIICATGQRPDLSLTAELRLRLDPALESTEALGPLIDPNLHSCGTVRPHGHRELAHPEPGFYTLGVKSYGRAPTFLMATGFEQARSVVAALAGDLTAADRVELDLPETGVCSADLGTEGGAVACCGPAPGAEAVDAAAAAAAAAPRGGCGPIGCAAPAATQPAAAAARPATRCCG